VYTGYIIKGSSEVNNAIAKFVVHGFRRVRILKTNNGLGEKKNVDDIAEHYGAVIIITGVNARIPVRRRLTSNELENDETPITCYLVRQRWSV